MFVLSQSASVPRLWVRGTYAAVGLSHLQSVRFTSAVASITESFRNIQPNAGYSEGDNLFLILDPVRIASRSYVFNGDVKNLGNTIGKTTDASREIVVFRPSLIDLASSLKVLVAHDGPLAESPRRRGNFEVRVTGGIAYRDVKQVCMPADIPKAERKKVKHFLDLISKARAEPGD